MVSPAQRRCLRRVMLHLSIIMIEFLNFRHFSSLPTLGILPAGPSQKQGQNNQFKKAESNFDCIGQDRFMIL